MGETECPKYVYTHDTAVDGLPKPAEGTAESNALETFAGEVTIILHTINEYETQAVLGEMGAPTLQPVQIEGPINLLGVPNKIILGMVQKCTCSNKTGGMCKKNLENALDRLSNIQAVIAIGVAYSKIQYKFGDVHVLVSKTVVVICTCHFMYFKVTKTNISGSDISCSHYVCGRVMCHWH